FEGALRYGTLTEWRDITQQLREQAQERQQREHERKEAALAMQLRTALASSTSGVMVADAQNVIVYANDTLYKLLGEAESELRQTLPGFNARDIIGKSMDVFHRHPAHQQQLVSGLREKHYARIHLGSRPVRLLMNPVFAEDGTRQGTIVEWRDQSVEVALENTALRAIEAAAKGDLSNRIEGGGRSGNMQKVFAAINQLLDMLQQVMGETGAAMSALAGGDLTRKIHGDYPGVYGSLRDGINNTGDRLLEVVREIRDSAAGVKAGAGEISSGNMELRLRTEQQAASLEQTTSAMEQIVTTVQQNAANAVQANTLARGAREAAENGGQVVGRAVAAMEAISTSSNKINDIIGVIDEIAFQTNLLALNAAVEAARAGDQGRGFAVVADEVRNLAGRSATAAKEIKALIKDSGDKVQEGALLVNESGATLGDIVTAVKKVNDIVAEIATASDEQASGLNEINRAVAQMDEMTRQNATMVEQAAIASTALGGQADGLDSLIAFFETGVAAPAVATSGIPAPRAPASRAPAPAKAAVAAARGTRSRTAATAKPKSTAASTGKRSTATASPRRERPSAAPKLDDDKNWTEF
ncbi:MAG TPA: methyl-accepting chemotaxis protein, partial [Hyphomicrobiales bacterium]|nr:methyl-accepting chemotaxis protein [Hyphomicrobiales bacterium]